MDVASLSALPVGVVLWQRPEPAMTVVVKATFSLGRDGEAALAAVQEPLGLDEPYAEPDDAELRAASDFAPLKARAEVLVVGSVRAEVPGTRLSGRFAVDRLERSFAAVASLPTSSLPLVSRYLRATSPDEPAPLLLGPRAAPPGPWWGHHAEQPVDFAAFNVAPAAQQLEQLRPAAVLELENLLPGVEYRKARLPGVRPVCYYVAAREPSGGQAPRAVGAREVVLRCDTLWIDTDHAICTLSWRGVLVLPADRDATAHLAVALQAEGPSRGFEELSAELPAAKWLRAVEPTTPLVPPCWVRAAPATRALPPLELPRVVALAPRSNQSLGLITSTAVTPAGPAEPFPFVPGPDLDEGPGDLPTVIRVEPPPTKGATGVIDREALLRSRPLPFDGTQRGPLPARLPERHAAPAPRGVQLGGTTLGQPGAHLSGSPVPSDETTTVGPRPAVHGLRQQTLVVEPPAQLGGDGLPFTRAIVDESLDTTRLDRAETRLPSPPTAPLPVMAPPASHAGAAALPPPTPPWSTTAPSGEPAQRLAPSTPGAVARAALPLPRAPTPLQPSARPARLDAGSPLPSASSDVAAPSARAPERSSIALETYAQIKAETWRRPDAIGEILERHGVDEALWQANERRQEQSLADEAREGRSELAVRLREALSRARAELSAGQAPTLTIDEYVELRVAIDCAADTAVVLHAKGMSADEWHRLRRLWHERSLADPGLARELRAKLAAVRRARQA